jgi:flagellar protein FlgJ
MDSTLSPVLSSGLIGTNTGSSPSNAKDPAKIREAAAQFESLLIGQMLKSMHEDEEGWLGTGEDQTANSAMGMADEYLAQSISKRGGLGLAQMISRQLDADPASSSSPEPPPSPNSAGMPHTDR